MEKSNTKFNFTNNNNNNINSTNLKKPERSLEPLVKIPKFVDLLKSKLPMEDLQAIAMANIYFDIDRILLYENDENKKKYTKEELLKHLVFYHNLLNQQLVLKYKGIRLDDIMENQISFKENVI